MVKRLPLDSRAKVLGLKQPKQLFCFARDIDGHYVYDEKTVIDNHLSYYYLPDSWVNHVDLGAGFKQFKQIPEEENLGDFAALLKAVMLHERATGKKTAVDLITFRGLMTKILMVPFQNDPIDFDIVAFDGQLFMRDNYELALKKRQQEEQQLNQQDPQQADYVRRCQYSGYKFEAVATLPKPWADCLRKLIENRVKKSVNNYEQFILAVKTGIGLTKMLLAGEVDCVYDYVPELGNIVSHFVELKTTSTLDNPRQVANFEKKFFRTWAQCFLMGVGKIAYGFRDKNFMLRSVETYTTDEVPILLKNNKQVNLMTALKWYGAALEWILKEVDRTDELKAWRLCYDPSTRLFMLDELMDTDNARLRSGELLTPEFIAWRQQLKEQSKENN